MQIVIDILEDVYTRLFDNGIQDNEIAVDDVCEMARALRRGISLPKGHGRLIDADNITFSQFFDAGDYAQARRGIYEAQTIIQADKVESEESK